MLKAVLIIGIIVVELTIFAVGVFFGTAKKIANEDKDIKVDTNIFDKETIVEDCTVQILENTHTGKISVGWWKNN